MGATKLLGERLMTAANLYVGGHKTKFSSVRFGNVLNTNGSVLKILKNQIDNNLPLTITSTDMSRFFITMNQALDLCFHAVEHMIGGEIFVMSMGCCKIMSLAKALCGNKPFEYEVIGQKSGEKQYEELVTETEVIRTVCENELYTIIPDTLDMMFPEIISKYKEAYDQLPRLASSLRSDRNMLEDSEVLNLLQSNGLVGNTLPKL